MTDPPWITTPAYDGPDRRARPRVALSEALTEVRELNTKVEALNTAVAVSQDEVNRVKLQLRLAMGALVMAGLGLIFTLFLTGEVRGLVHRVEDCTTPEGECYQRSTVPAREATRDAHQEILCVLGFEPAERTTGVFEQCEQGSN